MTYNFSKFTLSGASLFLLAVISGCGLLPARKVWDNAQANVIGMPEDKMLACMGEPATKRENGSTKNFLYGYRVTFDNGAAWCIVDLQTNAGKVSRMTKRSGFPSSMVNGDWVCGHVVEQCFGDGKLDEALNNLPGFIDGVRMRDIEAEAMQAQAWGTAASNASLSRAMALSSAVNSVASTSRSTGALNSMPSSIAAVSSTNNNTLGPAPRQISTLPSQSSQSAQRNNQDSSSQGVAYDADRSAGANSASPKLSIQESQIKVALTDQILSNGNYNLWRITVNNSSSFTVRCFISANYKFSDPNGTGRLVSDSATRTVTVSARSTGNTDYGFTDRNIQSGSYRLMNCSKM